MKKTVLFFLLTSFILPFGAANIAQAENLTVQTEKEEAIPYPYPYPYISVRVLSPNGGETWDRDQLQTIKWEVIKEYPVYAQNQEKVCKENEKCGPYWPKNVTIDLYRRLAVITCETTQNDQTKTNCVHSPENTEFVKHIAVADIESRYYSWKITPDIPDGKDYLIRITPQFVVSNKVKTEEPGSVIYPYPNWGWDESDGPFTITTAVHPRPDLKPIIKALEEISLNLERAIKELIKAIEALKELVVIY